MPQELHPWCYGSPRYASAAGTLKFTVLPQKQFWGTNCEQHKN